MSSSAANNPRQPGFWPSDLSAADVVAGMKEYGQLQTDPQGRLYWVEFRPEEGGRSVICRESAQGIETLTPESYNVRSRVHEYGGTSWCLLDNRLAFVNNQDQQLYLQWFDPVGAHSVGEACDTADATDATKRLTNYPGYRFLEPIWQPSHDRLIAICEDHSGAEVINTLVAIGLDSGEMKTLHQGHDFYAYSTLSDDGDQLAFIAWDHPDQPWTWTKLYHGNLSDAGEFDNFSCIAAGDQSLTQPLFDVDNQLLAVSDLKNDWKIYRYLAGFSDKAQNPEPAATTPALISQTGGECATAGWQCGLRHHAITTPGLVSVSFERGVGRLWLTDRAGNASEIATTFNHFRHLHGRGNKLYAVALSESTTSAVIEVDLTRAETRIVAGGRQPLDAGNLSRPQHFSYALNSNEQAHGFFYPPANAACSSDQQLPPLVIFIHGGPSGATYPVLNMRLQYWTQRGFAVADLNYRGSTGYGREYRMRLQGSWGVTDVEDVDAAIDYLAEQQLIDADKVFIRGNSAGGYTSLACLVASDRFRAGASLYGVSDPLTLTRNTHKFESRYLDWLIGDPVTESHRYQQRAPLHHADRIRCPVIFFQGSEDKVVLPEQTTQMADQLRRNGIETELHLFPDEQHGFRKAENNITVLERELAFYQRYLG